jgi:PPP family 3-phenylpropionic acid transporter
VREAVALSAFWFFCLGALGVFFPFYSLYLREDLGLAGWQIGVLLAVPPMVAIAAQPAWGVLADRTGSRARVLGILSLGSALGYASLLLGHDFLSMLGLTSLLSLFTMPVVPTAVAVTFASTQGSGNAFGRYRAWGTVGFGLFVFGFPIALARLQPGIGLAGMFPITAAMMLAAGAIAFALPRAPALEVRSSRGDWRRLLAHAPYLRLLGVALLGYLTLQGPLQLFPIYVRAHGGSLDTVSQLWLLMLVLELPLVAFSGASLARVGARGLLGIGLAAGGVRWIVCGFAPESSWMMPVQILHGITVAGLVIGGPLYVEAVVPEKLRATGQNLLAMVGVSVGGLLSNLAAGRLLDVAGPDAPYQIGGIGAVAVAASLPLWLPPPHRAAD